MAFSVSPLVYSGPRLGTNHLSRLEILATSSPSHIASVVSKGFYTRIPFMVLPYAGQQNDGHGHANKRSHG